MNTRNSSALIARAVAVQPLGKSVRQAVGRYSTALIDRLVDGDAGGDMFELALAQLDAMGQPPSGAVLDQIIDLLPALWWRIDARLLSLLCKQVGQWPYDHVRAAEDRDMQLVAAWLEALAEHDRDAPEDARRNWRALRDAATGWYIRDREHLLQARSEWRATLEPQHFSYYTLTPVESSRQLAELGDVVGRALWDRQLADRAMAGTLELYAVSGPGIYPGGTVCVLTVEKQGRRWHAGRILCAPTQPLTQSLCRLCHTCASRVNAIATGRELWAAGDKVKRVFGFEAFMQRLPSLAAGVPAPKQQSAGQRS